MNLKITFRIYCVFKTFNRIKHCVT
uniref:Uncharacterized protein n=1 Tax=Anguilla anguilla TaxID=7936 RepID=A0A0E9P7K1_ANGAN